MILQLDEIKYIFNPAKLRPGDILLMNTYEEDMRQKMGCRYEHAAIYLGDAYMMEANGVHVLMTHIYSYAFREREHACVLRMNKSSPITLSNVVRAAFNQVGRDYINTIQFRHVRALKESQRKDTSNRSFCSRLVAQAYATENINLVTNPDYCEPDDFLKVPELEEITDGVMSFPAELSRVVMYQQKHREETEFDSPNAEMFSAMSQLYSEDIQDLGQAILCSLKYPEKDADAIEVVRSSRMFKVMDDVKRDTPWLLNDDEFLTHFPESYKALHCIYSLLEHYDKTYIPRFRELHIQLITTAYYFPNSKFIQFLCDYIQNMVDEAITIRKRLGELFVLMHDQRQTDFDAFVEEYGFYYEYNYEPKPIDISFVLHDIMKATYHSKKQ